MTGRSMPFYILPLLVLLLLPFSLHAESAPTLTLDQVLAIALEKSDPALEAQKKHDEREAEAREAATLDNPDFQIEGERKSTINGTGMAAELYQPFKLSHLTFSRSEYASRLRQLGEGEKKLELFKAMNDISAAYLKLWGLQARKSLYERSLAEAGYVGDALHTGEHEGQTPVSVREIFRGDAGRLSAELKAVMADMQVARLELSHLTGQNISSAVLEKPVFSPIPASPESLFKLAQSRTTWRSVLKDRVSAAEERLSVAQTDALMPEIGPRLVYKENQDGTQETYAFGIKMRIPLWNQNDAERARAHAEDNMTRMQNARYQNLPAEDTIRALHQAALNRATYLETLEKNVLPRYRKSYELMRGMVKQGQASPVELWSLREKLYQTEETAITATTDTYLARLRLEAEIGGKLEETP